MELRQEIEFFIEDFIRNDLNGQFRQTVFGSPEIGFADADSDYLKNIRQFTNNNHALPKDIMPNANTVIAYYIPFSKELAAGNDNRTDCTDKENSFEYSSENWAQAYLELNSLMANLNDALVSYVQSKGFGAAVPTKAAVFDKSILMSYWSQRHIAYAAGLGTFGMNNMLISRKGCCGRYSSIVTAIPSTVIKPDKPMTEELCMYKRNGSCGVCMQRCPVHALSVDLEYNKPSHFNRTDCFEICLKNEEKYPGADVCGKCVTAAACAFLE